MVLRHIALITLMRLPLWRDAAILMHRWRTRRLDRFPRTLPLQTERLALPLLPLALLLLLLSLLTLVCTSAPKVFAMCRHTIRDFPPPLVEFDRLRFLDATHESLALVLTGWTQRLDLPALVRVRDDLAVRRV
jgi:hypothetical protein